MPNLKEPRQGRTDRSSAPTASGCRPRRAQSGRTSPGSASSVGGTVHAEGRHPGRRREARCRRRGATAISVSNHGGNNLDGDAGDDPGACPRSPMPSATRSRCCSTAASAAAATSSRPSPRGQGGHDRPRLPLGPRPPTDRPGSRTCSTSSVRASTPRCLAWRNRPCATSGRATSSCPRVSPACSAPSDPRPDRAFGLGAARVDPSSRRCSSQCTTPGSRLIGSRRVRGTGPSRHYALQHVECGFGVAVKDMALSSRNGTCLGGVRASVALPKMPAKTRMPIRGWKRHTVYASQPGSRIRSLSSRRV